MGFGIQGNRQCPIWLRDIGVSTVWGLGFEACTILKGQRIKRGLGTLDLACTILHVADLKGLSAQAHGTIYWNFPRGADVAAASSIAVTKFTTIATTGHN